MQQDSPHRIYHRQLCPHVVESLADRPGNHLPVCAAPARCKERFERHARLHLTFDEITASAGKLLTNSTVARIIACSYPLIVIDEFQDCIGPKLDFLRALADASQLILAAEPFSCWMAIIGCPAVEWVESLGNAGLRERHRLTEPWRFPNPGISGCPRPAGTGPSCKPDCSSLLRSSSPAAWRIMERLVLGRNGPRWTGTTA